MLPPIDEATLGIGQRLQAHPNLTARLHVLVGTHVLVRGDLVGRQEDRLERPDQVLALAQLLVQAQGKAPDLLDELPARLAFAAVPFQVCQPQRAAQTQ
jgi:hypothetical protein